MSHYASLSSANNIWIVGSFPKQPAANAAINGWRLFADLLLIMLYFAILAYTSHDYLSVCFISF